MLLRPLPYPEADRIMHLRQPQVAAGVEDIELLVRGSRATTGRRRQTIDQFVEFGDWTFNVLGRGEPHRATGGLVTANFFPMLGARPHLGRMLLPADEAQGRAAGGGADLRLLAARVRLRSRRRRPDCWI